MLVCCCVLCCCVCCCVLCCVWVEDRQGISYIYCLYYCVCVYNNNYYYTQIAYTYTHTRPLPLCPPPPPPSPPLPLTIPSPPYSPGRAKGGTHGFPSPDDAPPPLTPPPAPPAPLWGPPLSSRLMRGAPPSSLESEDEVLVLLLDEDPGLLKRSQPVSHAS